MKKILLLACAAFAGMSAFAYTAEEIASTGKVWRSISTADVYYQGSRYLYQYTSNLPYLLEGDVNCSVNDKGQLVIDLGIDETLFNGEVSELPLILNINGTTATAANGSFNIYLKTGGSGSIGYVTDLMFIRITNVGDYFYGLIPLRDNLEPKFGDFTGKVTKDADGNYRIDFGPFEMVKIHQTRGNVYVFDVYGNMINRNIQNIYYFDIDQQQESAGAVFQTYVPNAVVTDKEYAYNNRLEKTNGVERSYTAGVKLTDNTIEIDNWSNFGWASVPYLDRDGIICSNHEKITGTFDKSSLSFEIHTSEIMISNMMWLDNVGTLGLWMRNMSGVYGYDIANDNYTTISGQVSDLGGIKHTGTNTWLNKLDNRTVLNGITIDFEDYFMVDVDDENYYEMSSYYEDTQIKVDGDLDYTHSVELVPNYYGYGPIYPNTYNVLYLNFDIKNMQNYNYVESYDLCFVPGYMTSVDYAAADFQDGENGHVLGNCIHIDDYISDFVPNTASRVRALNAEINPEGENNFNILVPESALANKDANGEYSVYLKANYTPESGLTPSFHSLKSLEDLFTTGVENILADSEEEAVYYNLNGVEVSADNMAAGVYVRRQGNTATKVVIK